jgi:hypothetical protein
MRFARDAFERRGGGQRTNRNMVVFLAPDTKRIDELADAVRYYLAWAWISQWVEELNLSPQQVKQVESNQTRSDEAVTARIAQTYHWALVPEQPDPARPPVITVEKADGANERLAERVTDKLTRAGLLAGSVAARSIRLDLDQKLSSVWSRGHITVGELWSYYCRYPYLTRLRDRSVLDEGVSSTLTSFTWEQDGFALADFFDEATGRYGGLVLPGAAAHYGQVTDATVLVVPSAAVSQAAEVFPPEAGTTGEPDTGAPPVVPVPRHPGGGTAAPKPANTRFFGVYRVDPERYGRDLTKLSQEILQPLAAVDGVELEITVELHARRAAGFPEDKVRVVLENARTLRFEQSSFEDE